MKLGIYAINLNRSRDRWAELSQQATELGLELMRIGAVDGSVIAEEDWIDWDERAFKRNMGRRALPGEYGCYRSHLNAFSIFLESDLSAAIIIEDDISLIADLPTRAKAVLDALPQADAIKLFNHRIVGFHRCSTSILGDHLGRTFHGPVGSAACYVVSRSGAEKLLKGLSIMNYPFDIALERGWETGADIFVTERNIVESKRPQSTIASRTEYRETKFSWWKRIPTHSIRIWEYLRRIKYAVSL